MYYVLCTGTNHIPNTDIPTLTPTHPHTLHPLCTLVLVHSNTHRYLQNIVENRRDPDYLIHMFTPEQIKKYKLNRAELDTFQLTFMELDVECRGWLGLNELKLLMVVMGEKFDREEILELLDEYDLDRSGGLDFMEFVILMKSLTSTGWTKVYMSMKRDVIGKSWINFLTRGKREDAQVPAQKLKKGEGRKLELAFRAHEQMAVKRETEKRWREMGVSVSTYRLPPLITDFPQANGHSLHHKSVMSVSDLGSNTRDGESKGGGSRWGGSASPSFSGKFTDAGGKDGGTW